MRAPSSRASIRSRREISRDYRDRELTVIAILNGSLIFMADLLRRIPLPLKLDCLSVASYHGGLETSGEVIFRQVALPDIQGRDVLLLDDILDSGNTLAAIREKLGTAGPRSMRVCVLLQKKKVRARPVDADYVGFEIEDEFVVGYGLDYMERYRNLPCIGVLRKELIAAMTVRVQFFSHLRDVAGVSESEAHVPEGASVADLLSVLYGRHPKLRDWDSSILVGAGVEFVDALSAQDGEIAIMPPVQGG